MKLTSNSNLKRRRLKNTNTRSSIPYAITKSAPQLLSFSLSIVKIYQISIPIGVPLVTIVFHGSVQSFCEFILVAVRTSHSPSLSSSLSPHSLDSPLLLPCCSRQRPQINSSRVLHQFHQVTPPLLHTCLYVHIFDLFFFSPQKIKN